MNQQRDVVDYIVQHTAYHFTNMTRKDHIITIVKCFKTGLVGSDLSKYISWYCRRHNAKDITKEEIEKLLCLI